MKFSFSIRFTFTDLILYFISANSDSWPLGASVVAVVSVDSRSWWLLSPQVPTEGPPPSCVVDPLLPALLLDIKAQDAFISTETYQQVMGMEGSCPLSGHSLLTPS